MAEEQGQDPAAWKAARLYLTIIMRYKEQIEEGESLSVAMLPSLVTPSNALVQKKAEDLKARFSPFVYERDFYAASMDAFGFVKAEVQQVLMPIQFWLKPEEVLDIGAGDVMDRCSLLASILIGMGNPSAKVLVDIKEESRKVVVYYEFLGKVHALDLKEGAKAYASKEDMLSDIGVLEEDTVYEFNDKAYSNLNA